MYSEENSAESTDESNQIETEPLDPQNVNDKIRLNTPLCQDPSNLANAKLFTFCGCGRCPPIVDPLSDITDEARNDYWALDVCDEPRAAVLKEAKRVYLAYQRAAYNSDDKRTSRYSDHRYGQYPRILSADRYFQNKYEDLTTVLFTRRIWPKDIHGDWIEPYLLDESLHAPLVMRKIRKSINYQLQNFDFEWVRVTATTKTAATPHEHRVFWIDDPDDEISVEHFRNALEIHWQYVPCAAEAEDYVDPDGREGAITIRHNPPLVDEKPAKPEAIRHGCKQMDGVERRIKNTQGAQYLASQLSHIWLGDKFHSECDDPRNTLLEGGAIAWATPSRWFGASNGVPKLDD